MMTITGEALIDLVVDHDGLVLAQPGGGPFNTARTIGRLGLGPAFLGRLSQDSFGYLLRASLEQDGVTLVVPQLADAPATLAAVDLDAAGVPRYRSYLAGTSSCALQYPLSCALQYPLLPAALPDSVNALHAGSLALVMEPIATSIERLITSDMPPDALVRSGPATKRKQPLPWQLPPPRSCYSGSEVEGDHQLRHREARNVRSCPTATAQRADAGVLERPAAGAGLRP